MSQVPVVEKEGFAFAGDEVYVIVQGGSYQRAQPSLLRHLMTARNASEPSLQWYQAQLIFYGLSPTPDKSVAKMRLNHHLHKTNEAKHIPPHIRDLERRLEKEWMLKAVTTIQKLSARHDRAFGQSTGNAQTSGPSGRRTPEPTNRPTSPRKGILKSPRTQQAQANPAFRDNHQHRRGRSVSFDESSKFRNQSPSPSPSRSRSRSRSEKLKANRDKRSAKYSNAPRLKAIKTFAGEYNITCASLEKEVPRRESNFKMTVAVGNDGNLWASFNLGLLSGIMRIPIPMTFSRSDRHMAFWRGAIGAKTGQLIHYNMDSIETTGANNNLRFPEEDQIWGMMMAASHGPYEFEAERYEDWEEVSQNEAKLAELSAAWESYGKFVHGAVVGTHVQGSQVQGGAQLPFITAAAAAASTRPVVGTHFQGPHVQGPHVQGPHVQGPHVQGPHVQGPHVQGPHVQGPHVQGPHVQAPHVQGTHVQGGGQLPFITASAAAAGQVWPNAFGMGHR